MLTVHETMPIRGVRQHERNLVDSPRDMGFSSRAPETLVSPQSKESFVCC